MSPGLVQSRVGQDPGNDGQGGESYWRVCRAVTLLRFMLSIFNLNIIFKMGTCSSNSLEHSWKWFIITASNQLEIISF